MGKKLLVSSIVLAAYLAYSFVDRFDPGSVKGKRVLVTGASSGIGKHLAYQYAKYGARLVITARREAALQKVVEKCKELGGPGGDYHYVAADMEKFEDTKRVIDTAIKKMGGLDTLVLNHAIYLTLDYWYGSQQNFTDLRRGFAVNFDSYVYLTSYARENLETSKGSIVVVSSINGKMPSPKYTIYTAEKHALEGFFGSLRQEFVLREKDVSVTIAVIGNSGTEGIHDILRNFGVSEEETKSFLDSMTPPSDVALAILKGGALRERQIYCPYWSSMLLTHLREIFPYLFQKILNDEATSFGN